MAEAIKHIIILIIGGLIFYLHFLNNEGFVHKYNGLMLSKIEHSDYWDLQQCNITWLKKMLAKLRL